MDNSFTIIKELALDSLITDVANRRNKQFFYHVTITLLKRFSTLFC